MVMVVLVVDVTSTSFCRQLNKKAQGGGNELKKFWTWIQKAFQNTIRKRWAAPTLRSSKGIQRAARIFARSRAPHRGGDGHEHRPYGLAPAVAGPGMTE